MLDDGSYNHDDNEDDPDAHSAALENAVAMFDLCGQVVNDTGCCAYCFATTLAGKLFLAAAHDKDQHNFERALNVFNAGVTKAYTILKERREGKLQ